MSLYQKYRPRTLERLRGNADLVKTLKGLLEKGNSPHCFLFHGPTGCGKTTLARILAYKLGCSGIDVREINTADMRGIDTVRDLIQKSQFMPVESAGTFWIIDECHKLTNDAQNALLKILEDTPEHVYFALCTTDPQKLLTTIKGRCSQFQVKPLSEDDMRGLLRHVVKREEDELEDNVYDIIVRDSMGLPRNALQILEQVLNAPVEDRPTVAEHAEFEYAQAIELCRALMKKAPWKVVASTLRGLKEQEAETIRRIVLGYCQAILLSGKDEYLAGVVMEEFINPFYDSGFPQLVYACYSIIKTK
jgi:DNA polymerase III gamma/tau subunit